MPACWAARLSPHCTFHPLCIVERESLTGTEMACVAAHNEASIKGTLRWLVRVLRLRHPLGRIIMWKKMGQVI